MKSRYVISKFCLVGFAIYCSIRVSAQTFTDLEVSFDPMTFARSEWVDVDNDGFLDLFVGGKDLSNSNRILIYRNNGDETFDAIPIAHLRDFAYDFGDFNEDGFIDIILAGRNPADQREFRIYLSNAGTSFSAQNFGLTGFSLGDVKWIDLDHDCDLDIIAAGENASGEEIVLLYKLSENIYQPVATSIVPVSRGKLGVMDANNDGKYDILVSGLTALGNPLTAVYTFSDDLSSSAYTTLLDNFSENSIDLGDYNGDGYVDLAFTGISDGLNKKSHLYRNNQVDGFTRLSSFMDHLSNSSIDFGDLNNDGLADMILTGSDEGGDKYLYYYQNSKSADGYSFAEIAHTLQVIYNGDVAIGDFNNDGSQDIFQIGNSNVSFQANLFSSDVAALPEANDAPSIPPNLESSTKEDTVFLSWDPASDDLTASSSLTYNVYISESADGADLVLSPLSDVATGFRRIMEPGNAGYRTELAIHGLPEGNYHWSVQAIDNGYKGSSFATEGTFTICYSFSLGADTAVCSDESIQLEVAGAMPGDVVNWYSVVEDEQVASGAFSYDHLVTQKDTIVAEWTKSAYGCIVRDSIVVDLIDLPVFSLGNDTAVCFMEFLELEVSAFDSVNWYSPGEGQLLKDSEKLSFLVEKKDTLTAEFFNTSGCVSYESIIVEPIALPDFTLGKDTAICYQETISFDASALDVVDLDSVNWYSRLQGSLLMDREQLTFTVSEKDTVIVEIFNTHGCVNYDSIVVDVLPLPDFYLGNDTSICYNETISFDASLLGVVDLDSVNWYSRLQGSLLKDSEQLTFTVTEKDTVIAELFNTNGCVNYDSIVIDVYPLPVFDIGNDTSICFSTSILLQLPNPTFDEINWYSKSSGKLLLADNWFFDYEVTQTDTIIAEVYNLNGCLNYDTIAIAMDPLPVYDLGADQEICFGDSAALEIPGDWDEVNWFTFDDQLLQGNSPAYAFLVEDTVTFWSEVFTADRCVVYDTITIHAKPLPEFELGEDRTYCFGDEVRFAVGDPGQTYSWTNAASEQVSASNSWSYTAEETDSLFLTVTSADACVYSDSVKVTVNPLPVFQIEGPAEVCLYDTISLSIAFGEFEQADWYTAADSLSSGELDFAFAPKESVMLYAELTDLNTCRSFDSLFVTVNPRPPALAGRDTLICFGETIELGGSYANASEYTFSWSPGETLSGVNLANPVASPDTPTTYFLEVTDLKNCNSFDTIYVEVNPEIVVNAGADIAICRGDSVIIGGEPTATGSMFAYAYAWSPAVGLSETGVPNPTAFPLSDQQYILEVRSGDCVVEYDTLEVVVNGAPEISVLPQQSVGPDESVRLQASGGISYLWSPEELLDDPEVADPLAFPLETTLFEVLVTDENGCDSTGYINVLVQNVLFIPNLFTPNGDGRNDYFQLFGSGIETVSFSVYDLNGNRVFLAEDKERAQVLGWDGTFGGEELSNGTYLWTLEGTFYDGSPLSFEGKTKGTIRLLR